MTTDTRRLFQDALDDWLQAERDLLEMRNAGPEEEQALDREYHRRLREYHQQAKERES